MIDDGLKISKYIVLSYNDDDRNIIIKINEMEELLGNYKYEKYEFKYDKFKGAKGLSQQLNIIVKDY